MLTLLRGLSLISIKTKPRIGIPGGIEWIPDSIPGTA